ncbi:MAG: ASCH domain-containing protein [Candidatus Leucobacter sulfamidivorax]|nr:ASCH domain-containing protein [Candidatus Leucobacter sulfamidivorax]
MRELRILTVRQPWAWAIIHGGKDVENRRQSIAGDYRGPIAIHAALKSATLTDADERLLLERDVDGKVDAWMGGEPIEGGVILGVVDLVDVHQQEGQYTGCDHRLIGGPAICSPWAERDTVHLVLANPRPLSDPIPSRGALGLRRLDEETSAAVWAGIGGDDV